MLRLFQHPSPFAMLALPVFLGVLCVSALLPESSPKLIVTGWSPFSGFIGWADGLQALGLLVSGGLLLVQAYFVNFLVERHRLLPRLSYLPAFVFLLIGGSFQSTIWPTSACLAHLFLLGAFHYLLQLANATRVLPLVFNYGFLIALGAFFYPPILAFFPLIFVGLTYFRSFQLREWLVAMVGLLLPFMYLWIGYGYLAQDQTLWMPLGFSTSILQVVGGLTPSEWGFLVVVGIAFALSLQPFIRLIGVNKVRMRRSLELLIWSLGAALLSQWIAPGASHQLLLLMSFPLSIFFANYALQARRVWIGELIFGVWVILCIYHQATGQ
ncbi:MAG: DUF6427 family protein [Salibacteraceae bacterium]